MLQLLMVVQLVVLPSLQLLLQLDFRRVFCISYREKLLLLLLLLRLLTAADDVENVETVLLLLFWLLLHTIGDMLSCSAFSISHAPMSQKIYHTLVAKIVPCFGKKSVRYRAAEGLQRVPPAESETLQY